LKFLCDNCKAKYQIADEKVAGKTVRMKCRKCGHQIEVRAAVTETSVSTSPPGALSAGGSEAPRAMGAKSGLATSLSAAKPRAPMGASQSNAPGALAGAFQRTVQDAPTSVPFPQGQGSPVELSVTDEWYVAINGVPVGPVRISELRRKAGTGAVTEDSLCWQEGLEEWRPVRSIPELAAIVREAAQGNRPSLVSPPGTDNRDGRASSPPRPPQPQRPSAPSAPAPVRSPEPPRASPSFEPLRPQAPSRSNVVPLRVAASTNDLRNSDDGPPITAPMGGGASGAAAFAPSFAPQPAPSFAPPQVQPAPLPPPPAPLAISDPFAVPPGPSGPLGGTASLAPPAPYAPSQPSIMMAQQPPQQRRGVPLWFWPVLLFTAVFGVSAAVFVFRQPPPQAPVVIQMPATSTAPTATEAKNDVPPPAPSAEPTTSATAPTGKVAVATGAPKSGGAAAAPQPEKKGIDLGGLVPGAGGPNVGGGSGPSGGAQGLDSSSVERVVASHRAGVKRTCWERGGADQKSSVNVLVSATVAPDGSVSGTSSSGDDPVVAKCIESQVRSWRFSAPGSTTTVNIPFKFVRQ
jgi:predicted Zn finger-like uncharacterized protein